MDRSSKPSAVNLRALAFAVIAALVMPAPVGAESIAAWTERAGSMGGGLCIQIGAVDIGPALELARTGRFLVQIVDRDPSRVEQARREIDAAGLYGLATAEVLHSASELPYAENLVNLLLVADDSATPVPPQEWQRVACPGGVVALRRPAAESLLESAGFVESRRVGPWTIAGKPWPEGLDAWTHPRHGADGNAVSEDLYVAPPRRVRWVAGASAEIANLVTAGGKNYYGGVWARDSFNGLRLWQRPLDPSPSRGGFDFRITSRSVPPIAGDSRLYVVSAGKLLALDSATGAPVAEFPDAAAPAEVLLADRTLLAIDGQSIRALDASGGRLIWKHDALNPQYTVGGEGAVFYLRGNQRLGDELTVVCLDLATGSVRWQRGDYPWLSKVRRLVCRNRVLALEISTLSDEKTGNELQVVAADDGRPLWSRSFVPGMNHMKQARAMFVGDLLWVLENRKAVALDPWTGEEKGSCPAGYCHCFPPVATARFMFAGEMDLTDLASGELDANRITKAACGRDVGWIPANGLIYVTPKHCVCWPMLRGYAALAPALPQPASASPPAELRPEPGELAASEIAPLSPDEVAADDDWPCYRRDAWRTGSTARDVPPQLKILWTTLLGDRPEGPVADDWRDNPFVGGPVTPPVIAAGRVFVARPDAHQVVALDARSGAALWRFTADGRVDTPPTIHRGLCLFGTKAGTVYCLRAADGRVVWQLAAGRGQQIVAYGQLESPWPVPGSVLAVDDTVCFAAGRHPLADGGILVAAVDLATGQPRWEKRLDSVPTTNFYGCSALEFDSFNLLHREGDSIAMSRWLFALADGAMDCRAAEAFARLTPGEGAVVVPRGWWTYAPRHQPRHGGEKAARRPLAVFRDNTLVSSLPDQRTVYRRDFTPEAAEKFDRTWITGWAASENYRKKSGEVYPSDRLAPDAAWTAAAFAEDEPEQTIAGMVLAGDVLFLAGSKGGLAAQSMSDGRILSRAELPASVWDGLAAAGGRLFASLHDGAIVCLGGE